jgi:hypothetical protein
MNCMGRRRNAARMSKDASGRLGEDEEGREAGREEGTEGEGKGEQGSSWAA